MAAHRLGRYWVFFNIFIRTKWSLLFIKGANNWSVDALSRLPLNKFIELITANIYLTIELDIANEIKKNQVLWDIFNGSYR